LAATVVVVLAVGIGATTAMFSIVEAVVLKPLPWPNADRLVAIYAVSPDRAANPAFSASWNRGQISWPAWQALRLSPAFEEIGVWARSRWVVGDPPKDSVEVWYASSSLLSLLGAQPSLGRLFTAEEDQYPSDVILISHECWQRRYGGRSDVIGQRAELTTAGGEAREVKAIVGVFPRGIHLRNDPPEFVLPMGLRAFSHAPYNDPAHFALARLAPGVSHVQATAAAEQIISRMATTPGRRSARIVLAREDVLGDSAHPLWLLLTAAGVLLFIACANVGGLLLGDVTDRSGELGLRAALGCSRRRILQQLTVEHALLAGMGALTGMVVAHWLVPTFVAIAPERLQGIEGADVDLRLGVLAVTCGVITVVVIGGVPAMLLATKRGIAPTLAHQRGRARGQAVQRSIVAAEIALGLVLIVCAALVGESLGRLTSRPLGFDPSGLAVVSIQITRFPDVPPVPGQLPIDVSWTHIAQMMERLTALPGVVRVAGAGTAPFAGGWRTASVRAEGRPAGEDQTVQIQIVTEEYRRTLGVPLLRGRDLEASDRGSRGERIVHVLVSRELERRTFGEDAVGQRLLRDGPGGEAPMIYDVVGVVGNVRHREFSDDEQATLYALGQRHTSINDLLIRSTGDPTAVLPEVRESIRGFDPHTVVTSSVPMDALLARSVAEERFRAALSVAFGGAALLLAATGLYALAARRVAERRREIGVRMALGASAGDVRRLVFRDASVTIALGVGAGLPAALVMGRFIRAYLYDVSPTSLSVLATASGVLAAAACAALVLPVRRATRIDPLLVLRE
jgi:putative ABC transport system permease protein